MKTHTHTHKIVIGELTEYDANWALIQFFMATIVMTLTSLPFNAHRQTEDKRDSREKKRIYSIFFDLQSRQCLLIKRQTKERAGRCKGRKKRMKRINFQEIIYDISSTPSSVRRRGYISIVLTFVLMLSVCVSCLLTCTHASRAPERTLSYFLSAFLKIPPCALFPAWPHKNEVCVQRELISILVLLSFMYDAI